MPDHFEYIKVRRINMLASKRKGNDFFSRENKKEVVMGDGAVLVNGKWNLKERSAFKSILEKPELLNKAYFDQHIKENAYKMVNNSLIKASLDDYEKATTVCFLSSNKSRKITPTAKALTQKANKEDVIVFVGLRTDSRTDGQPVGCETLRGAENRHEILTDIIENGFKVYHKDILSNKKVLMTSQESGLMPTGYKVIDGKLKSTIEPDRDPLTNEAVISDRTVILFTDHHGTKKTILTEASMPYFDGFRNIDSKNISYTEMKRTYTEKGDKYFFEKNRQYFAQQSDYSVFLGRKDITPDKKFPYTYQTDENGKIVKDKNGEAVKLAEGSSRSIYKEIYNAVDNCLSLNNSGTLEVNLKL